MKKILIHGPMFSCSGYGEMARFAFEVLTEREDLFDVYINIINWGKTGYLFEENEQYLKLLKYRIKSEKYFLESNKNPQYDVSLQITIPNEWKRIAPINIGYTAGIETTHVSPAWLEPSNVMDKIITISDFSRNTFLNTIFGDQSGNEHKIKTPIETVYFPSKQLKNKNIELNLTTDFNFLCVNQWGPRKNIEILINSFIEEFKNENIGLVLKANRASDSTIDKLEVEKALTELINRHPDKKCKIYLLHGRMTDEEIFGLYNHPSVKAFVTATHGEGFGLPIFEAMQAELPVIATDWSAHLEFLSIKDKKMFAKVDYDLGRIAKEHVWPGVMEENVGWAYPKVASLKSRMREVYKDYGRFKSWAKKLATHNKEKFNKEKIYEDFFYALGLFSRPKKIDVEKINGISFCIPTNGKRIEKTARTIKSIQAQNWGDIKYEIIISGDIDNIVDGENIFKIDLKEDAHSRKVARLRNASAEKAKYSNIVFCDDDIILEKKWLENTLNYSKNNGWEVLGNKILNPDGTRHWDRGILVPRKLVSYDHSDNDKNLMQTSGFFMIKKKIFNDIKWDESKLVYADRQEKEIPEDVKFNLDLHNKNITISFNKEAVVWHNDENYTEYLDMTLTNEMVSKMLNTKVDLVFSREYKKMEKEYEF